MNGILKFYSGSSSMSVYLVTGKLGNGKTLVTVGRIKEAIKSGAKIATNLDINLKNMFGREAKNINLMRIPDKPTIDDLNAIGKGYDGHDYDESKFGLLVLDECGTWFNSRNWQDKSRKAVNDWFLHARKLRWHVYIIIQDESMLDSQARDAIGEMLVRCRRLDNLRIPVIGGLVKALTGFNLRMPRVHRAKVTYGADSDLVSDVWVYRGTELFDCYDTGQMFIADYPHGTHCVLTPWHIYGRYKVDMNWRNIMRLTKIYWRRFANPVVGATGMLLGGFLMMLVSQQPVAVSVPVQHLSPDRIEQIDLPADDVTIDDSEPVIPFSDSRFVFVGNFGSELMFKAYLPDGSYVNLNSSDLKRFGYEVARMSDRTALIMLKQKAIFAHMNDMHQQIAFESADSSAHN